MATAAALRAMGATIERDGEGDWSIHGVGVGGLLQPEAPLDMGNSGTSTRLLMGLVASHPITAQFTGDASLSKRPMGRVIEPLGLMGADFSAAGTLPLTDARPQPRGADHLPPAGRQRAGEERGAARRAQHRRASPRVIEPVPTRDHTERMLKGFGAELWVEEDERRARHPHARRGRAAAADHRGARRSLLGRVLRRRRADRARQRPRDRERRPQPDPRRALSTCCARWARSIEELDRARGRRRAGRGPARAPLAADRHRGRPRARPEHDRRVPGAVRRRRAGRRAARSRAASTSCGSRNRDRLAAMAAALRRRRRAGRGARGRPGHRRHRRRAAAPAAARSPPTSTTASP